MKNNIAKMREMCNPKLSQEKLAKAADISRTYLSEIENGKANPGIDIILRIASVLKKPVEEIFCLECKQ